MHKKLSLFPVFLLLILGYSCKKEDKGHEVDPILNISRSTVDVGNDAGFSDTVTIRSNVDWTISLSDGANTWLSVDPVKSAAGDSAIVKITVTAANISKSQTATITITPANSDIPSRQINISRKSYSLVWQKCYGGSGEDQCNETVAFPNGQFVTAGFSESIDGDALGNSGESLGWILRLGSDANKIWQKPVAGLGGDYLSVVANTDGSTVSAGYVFINGRYADFLVTKIDVNGNLVWSRTYGGTDYDNASDLIATSDGGYLVSGTTSSKDGHIKTNHGGIDIWVMKLDSNGSLVWEKSFGSAGDEYPVGLVASSDGGYMLCGSSKSSNSGDVPASHGRDDILIVKMDANGNKVWSKNYGGSLVDTPGSIISDANGGFIVTGCTNSSDGDLKGRPVDPNIDLWAFKLNNDGEIGWQTILGGSEPDWGHSLVRLPDSKIAILGATLSANGDVTVNHGSIDAWVVVLSSTGKKLWQRSFGSSGTDYESDIDVTADGSLLVTCNTLGNDGDVSGNHGDYDVWIFKLQ